MAAHPGDEHGDWSAKTWLCGAHKGEFEPNYQEFPPPHAIIPSVQPTIGVRLIVKKYLQALRTAQARLTSLVGNRGRDVPEPVSATADALLRPRWFPHSPRRLRRRLPQLRAVPPARKAKAR
jgi:hypothetical protein